MTGQVRKQEIARFAVIDVSNGNVGNVYFEVHEVGQERDSESDEWRQFGAVAKRNEPATVADVAAFVGENNAALAAAHAQLTAQYEALSTVAGKMRVALEAVVDAQAAMSSE